MWNKLLSSLERRFSRSIRGTTRNARRRLSIERMEPRQLLAATWIAPNAKWIDVSSWSGNTVPPPSTDEIDFSSVPNLSPGDSQATVKLDKSRTYANAIIYANLQRTNLDLQGNNLTALGMRVGARPAVDPNVSIRIMNGLANKFPGTLSVGDVFVGHGGLWQGAMGVGSNAILQANNITIGEYTNGIGSFYVFGDAMVKAGTIRVGAGDANVSENGRIRAKTLAVTGAEDPSQANSVAGGELTIRDESTVTVAGQLQVGDYSGTVEVKSGGHPTEPIV